MTAEPSTSTPGTFESFLWDTPAYGVTFYYAIRTVDETGNYSDVDSDAAGFVTQENAVTIDLTPAAVTSFQAIASKNQVTLAWGPKSHADFWKYEIYRSSVSAGSLVLHDTLLDETTSSYNDFNLVDGVTYYYQLITYDFGAPDYLGVALTSATAIVQGVPTPFAPNKPVIDSASAGFSTTSINWAWTLATPPLVSTFTVHVGTSNVSGGLSGSTSFYVQTGLQPNEAVSAIVRAANGAGSTDSDPKVRYALANPPSNTAITAVSFTSIDLSWLANGNQGSPLYEVVYARSVSFTDATTVQYALTSANIPNLNPGTQYYMRVRTLNGDGLPSGFDVWVTTETRGIPDSVAPATPGGLSGRVLSLAGNTVSLEISWADVVRNEDGSAAGDLAGYMVYVGSDWALPDSDWVVPVTTATAISTSVTISPDSYIGIRAVDGSGNQSRTSAIIRASDLKFIIVADDQISRMEYTLDLAQKLTAVAGVGTQATAVDAHYILGNEFISHYTNGKVIKSVRFTAYAVDTGLPIDGAIFDESEAEFYIRYDVSGGNIVQGTPARVSYFQNLLANNQNLIAQAGPSQMVPVVTNETLAMIGNPVLADGNIQNKLSLFWFNGVTWVKIGGNLDDASHMLTFTSARLGYYQIRQAARLGDVTLVQVYPRIITPNGDGANDSAVFQFGEADVSGTSITGEIFDITGAKVGSLKPGPDASTLVWDGKDSGGTVVPAGIYIYQIEVGGQIANGTVVVAR